MHLEPSSDSTLVERLEQLAATRGEQLAYRFLHMGEARGPQTRLSYAQLRQRARGLATRLRADLPEGTRVLLLCDGGVEFIEAFWACLYARVIAVPAYPPDPRRWQRTLPRLLALVTDAAPEALVLDPRTADAFAMLERRLGEDERAALGPLAELPRVVVDASEPQPEVGALSLPRPEDLAYLQYTSGSTGQPKGVVVSHANLSHNCEDIAFGWGYTPDSHAVSWLPTFHDLGLIWGLLVPIHVGFSATIFHPVAFMQRPARWLEALSSFRATHTAGPNFAYELCAHKLDPSSLDALDLSRLQVAINAAEPVRASTIAAFCARFESAGFDPRAMCPCFGIAEATLKVSTSMPDALALQLEFDAEALERGRVRELGAGEGERRVTLVGCGRPALDTRVEIVDPETLRRCGTDEVGEIWVRGSGIAQGYWRRAEASEQTFGARIEGQGPTHMRTGDLGFMRQGQLFIAGRIKDVVILRGRNVYPQDIEAAVERCHRALRPGCVAAFASRGPAKLARIGDAPELLVVVAELEPARLGEVSPAALGEVFAAVRAQVRDALEVSPHLIALIPPRTIAKTSSGKIMRRGTRAAFEAGTLELIGEWIAPELLEAAAELEGSEGPGVGRTRAELESLVRRELGALLGVELDQLPSLEAGVDSLGLDSLEVLSLRTRLSKALGERLAPELLYELGSLAELVELLSEEAPEPALSDQLRAAEPGQRAELLRAPLERLVARTLGRGRGQVPPGQSLRELGVDEVLGAELCLSIKRLAGVRVLPRETLDRASFEDLLAHVAGACGPHVRTQPRRELAELDASVDSPHDSAAALAVREPSQQELVFVLSPPRSGSTLLRVMLAGHSGLFSPQELHLGPFASMASYDRHLRGTVLDMGLVATLAEVLSRTGAWTQYREWVREDLDTAAVYAFLAEHIGGRTLVDKSPLFFPPAAVLERLAALFPRARFIHLVRHPLASIESYARERFHALHEQTQELDPYDAGEWVWTRCHEAILDFQARHAERVTRLYFEDLVRAPERTMRRLCPELGLSFEPALLDPYGGHRMVAGGFQIGDPNFVHHDRILAAKAERWREIELPDPLQADTEALARRLGYVTRVDDAIMAAPGPSAPTQQQPVTHRTEGPAKGGGLALERDAQLPTDLLEAARACTPRQTGSERVLLTGATGFLGVFVLAELLARSSARVVCLVRASNPEAACERVIANAGRYGIGERLSLGRLEFVCGDLEQERLGLEPDVRRQLTSGAGALDAIYHCGAQVSWLQPYRKLRGTNVGGLQRIMRLATDAGGAQLHYVSSLGSALIRPFEAHTMIEEVLARSGLGRESIVELPLGYFESKWVGGRLLAAAREAGLPCTLYGPGLIAGHSRSGVDSLSSAQFVHALIEGSAQLGMFPDARGWRFIPVDLAAQQIVALSQLEGARGRDLYLDSAVSLQPEHVLEALAAHGYDTRLVSYSVWRQRVLELADAGDSGNALFGFTDVIYTLTPLRMLGQEHQLDWYRANTGAPEEVHAQLGERRYLDRELVRRLIDYYVAVGAMPSPA